MGQSDAARVCSLCGESQPLTEFYRARRPNGRIYYGSWCKRCARAYSAKQYRKRKAARGPTIRIAPEPKRGRGSTENRDAYGSGLERHLHGSPGYILMHEMCEAVEQAMMRAGLKRFTGLSTDGKQVA